MISPCNLGKNIKKRGQGEKPVKVKEKPKERYRQRGEARKKGEILGFQRNSVTRKLRVKEA